MRNDRDLDEAVDDDRIGARYRWPSCGSSFYPPCKVNVVVDGMGHQEINDTPPLIIEAMELYRAGTSMPAEIIDNWCGSIVIWTKRGR